jgi:glycosyltransferase involved in cell wall biosynthesis
MDDEGVKIVHLIARFNSGGTAKWLMELVNGLRKNGIKTEIYSGEVQNGEIEDLNFSKLGGNKIPSVGRKISIISDLKSIYTFRKILIKENPKILNTHTAKAGFIGRLASIGLSIKVVHTYHGHIFYGYFNPALTKGVILLERILNTLTDAYIVNGDKVKKDLISERIGAATKFNVIHPGVKQEKFGDRKSLRKKLRVDEQKLVVGWLGRITQIKRIDRLIELAHLYPSILFLVGGDGDQKKIFEKTAPKNVKFLGWVEQRNFWPLCDIAFLTSDNEATPISLIEAAYAGIPIVAQNVGSVREVFENGVGGFLVSEKSELSRVIKVLTEDKALRIKMGREARRYATSNFSIEAFISEHLKVYDSL